MVKHEKSTRICTHAKETLRETRKIDETNATATSDKGLAIKSNKHRNMRAIRSSSFSWQLRVIHIVSMNQQKNDT